MRVQQLPVPRWKEEERQTGSPSPRHLVLSDDELWRLGKEAQMPRFLVMVINALSPLSPPSDL